MIKKDERYFFILEKAHAIGFRVFIVAAVVTLLHRFSLNQKSSNDLFFVLIISSIAFISTYFYYKSKY